MLEREGYIPPEASIENEQKEGLFERINAFILKHPKLNKTVRALTLAAYLVAADRLDTLMGGNVKREVEHILIQTPEVQKPSIQPVSEQDYILAEKLRQEIGNVEVNPTIMYESIDGADEREKLRKIPGKIRIHGFEKFSSPNEEIFNIVEKTFPKAFDRNIKSIEYIDVYPLKTIQYGIKQMESATTLASAHRDVGSIEIFRPSKDYEKNWFATRILGHEIFHLSDWQSNRLLTRHERLELLENIVKRLKSKDRYKSHYVESISNPDKKRELSIKANEYFAEIGSEYISDGYQLLPAADKRLIRELIKKIDPDFNRAKALKLRHKMLDKRIKVPTEEVESIEERIARLPSVEELIETMKKPFIQANKELPPEEAFRQAAEKWHEQLIESVKKELR